VHEVILTLSSDFQIRRDFLRLWTVPSGRLMVVTDLHGDWEAYQRIRARFLELHQQQEVDALVFTGDLIHRDPDDGEDRSFDMILDVIKLQEQYGNRVVCLLGNHEMPHIYTTTLARGRIAYTPPFELALSARGAREQVKAFLSSLPFYLRTAAGVSLAHAGAAPVLADTQVAPTLFEWDHNQMLQQAEQLLAGKDREKLRESFAHMSGEKAYETLVSGFFGLQGPESRQFDDPLRGFLVTLSPAYRILWAALFTRSEKEYGSRYPEILSGALAQLSQNYNTQRILVSGHMGVSGGVKAISMGDTGCSQLRIASATHALPRKSGRYLILDAEKPVSHARDLLTSIHKLF
jgi:hypothetical protein